MSAVLETPEEEATGTSVEVVCGGLESSGFEISGGLRCEVIETLEGNIEVHFDWDEGSPWEHLMTNGGPEEILERAVDAIIADAKRELEELEGAEVKDN